ncbi:MAG TPA: hypothetical protein VHU61_04895 [Solirubrobacteraceae bacterium]|nr:hypothetical protein [Solirubrobacteraceae bacterium]
MSKQRETIDAGEAQRAAHVHFRLSCGGQRGAQKLDLAVDACDELGPVTTLDRENCVLGREEAADTLDPNLPAVVLSIDHGHATGADRDVIDVLPPRPGHETIMEQPDLASGQELLQPGADALLAFAATLPSLCGCGRIDDSGKGYSQATELLARVILSRLLAPLVFPQSARACFAGDDRLAVKAASQASHDTRSPMPERLDTHIQLAVANNTDIGAA